MKLPDFLLQKRPEIFNKWFDLLLSVYPEDTARLMKSKEERFANPVAYAAKDALEGIYISLYEDFDSAGIRPLLDDIIRIRAVQEFCPSVALAFIPGLKKIVRETLRISNGSGPSADGLHDELALLDERIDSLTLLAFDIYMQCKEKLYEIRANETRNLTFRLLQQAELLHIREEKPELMSIDSITNRKKRGG
jgi:hypothetical protein